MTASPISLTLNFFIAELNYRILDAMSYKTYDVRLILIQMGEKVIRFSLKIESSL
jgi:hypothetical protein